LPIDIATTQFFQRAAKTLISLASRQKSREETAFGVEPGSDSCRVTTPDNLRSAHREAVLTGSWTEAPFAGLSA
jgi:hypothetical protein